MVMFHAWTMRVISSIKFILTLIFISSILLCQAQTTRPLTEEDFYELRTISIPEDIKLEVGGHSRIKRWQSCGEHSSR